MNAYIQDAGMRLTKSIDRILVENANHFVQPYLGCRPRQRISAIGAASRSHQAGLNQNPHQFAGVRHRKAFKVGNLMQRQRLTASLGSRQLDQASQTVLFMCRNLHFGSFLSISA
jgi:hypothetical protein